MATLAGANPVHPFVETHNERPSMTDIKKKTKGQKVAKKKRRRPKKKTPKLKQLKGFQEFDLGESATFGWGLICHSDHDSFRLEFVEGDERLVLRLPAKMLTSIAVEAIKGSGLKSFRMRHVKSKNAWDINMDAGPKGDIRFCFRGS